jgi:hypothetical protein
MQGKGMINGEEGCMEMLVMNVSIDKSSMLGTMRFLRQ